MESHETKALKIHSKLARACISKVCSVSQANGASVFDFEIDSASLVFLDQPIQRPFDDGRLSELAKEFLEDSYKDMMVGQVICTNLTATPQDVLKDLLKKNREFQYGISGGQHTVKTIRMLSETHGAKFLDENPKLQKFQAKVFAMGNLTEFNRLFNHAIGETEPTATYDTMHKIRHFSHSSDPFLQWKANVKSKHKAMMLLSTEEQLHVPEVEEAMKQLRVEHNVMGTSSQATWVQRLTNARIVWKKAAVTVDPGDAASGSSKAAFDQFTSTLKTELGVNSVSSALKYKNILSLEEDAWGSVLEILEKDSKLELLDHSPRILATKVVNGAKKSVFNITSMLNLCNLAAVSDDNVVEVHDVLRSIAERKITFDSIREQIKLIRVQ